jgi:hypothetical protein
VTAFAVTFPGGIWLDSERHRDAELRQLTGADEIVVAESRGLPAERATALLARCLTRLGPDEDVRPDDVRALTIGDREALLLHLRRISFGEQLQCVLDCPECGERTEFESAVEDVLVPPYADARDWYEATLGGADGEPVRFRLPRGADQEAAAALAEDSGAATAVLVRRCVGHDVDPEAVEHLSPLMAELDPQAEIRFSLTCPLCDRSLSLIFDATDFLFRELASEAGEVFREVHLLAVYYGWSEAEILALPTSRRRLYLQLLANSFSEQTTA